MSGGGNGGGGTSSTHLQNLRGPDHISEVYDELLTKILSLLPTQEAVRTAILNHRWNRRLWAHIDQLSFHSDITDLYELRSFLAFFKFALFVNNTLRELTCQDLKKFSLTMVYDIRIKGLIGKWIDYVWSKSIQFLKIKWLHSVDSLEDDHYCPSEFFYHSSSLQEMELTNWKFVISREVGWFSLKRLSLTSVIIGNDEIAYVLAGCPLLHTLIMNGVRTISILEITSPQLRRLALINFQDGDDGCLLINASSLTELEISGDFLKTDRVRFTVPSLVYAKLLFGCFLEDTPDDDVKNPMTEVAADVLKIYVPRVKQLVLGSMFCQALTIMEWKELSTWLKCEQLTIQSPLFKYELPGISCLLQSSPYLKTLIIQVVNPYPGQNQDPEYLEGFDCTGPEYLEAGVEFDFKNVEVEFRRTLGLAHCHIFDLVKYLLNSVPLLKRLVIKAQRNFFDSDLKMDMARQYLSSLSGKFSAVCKIKEIGFDFEVELSLGQ